MNPSSLQALFPGIDLSGFSLLPVMDSFYEGVMITDTDGRILYLNAAQGKIDDFEPSYAVGRMVTDIYRVDEGISPTMLCLRTGRPIDNRACFYRTRLGKVVNSLHNVFPLHAGGALIGAICFVRDYGTVAQTFESVAAPRGKRLPQTFDADPARWKRRDHRNGTRFTFDDIIGTSPDFLQAVEAARLSSDSPSPLMLFGETGTGKELFAQSIHNNSRRRPARYVAVNCAAIPENLLEGILFGTSRGAFTGAVDKQGLFERANGGTLFLDEVNAMPMGLQAKLLRALQERKIRRVGSLDETEIQVKIISSVNEEPHQAIARGALRPDLFYRLGVVFIRIPPLRERMADLEPLIGHFLQKINAMLGKRVNAISAEVMERFHRYRWPGNVRELEHVIEGALNLVDEHDTVAFRHLPPHLSPSDTASEPQGAGAEDRAATPGRGRVNIVFPAPHPAPAAGGKALPEQQRDHEIRSIEAALAGTGGNAAKAARRLGLSPQLLHYKLKKYRIDRSAFKKRKGTFR